MWQIKAVAQCMLPPALAWVLLSLQGCDEVAQTIKDIESKLDGDNGNKSTNRSYKASSVSKSSPLQESARMSANVINQKASIPLAATSWSGGVRLLMAVSPVGPNGELLPAQSLVVDTGSSTLAFCQSSFLQEANYQSTKYISCNQYNPGGDPTGYWGPFVVGELRAGNVTFQQASYSIMAQEENMPCKDGIQGIFGIAFRQLDVGFPADQRPDWSSGVAAASCPEAAGVVPPPLIQKLRAQGGVEKLGIHWSGQLGENQGRLYLDDDAVLNEHYDKSSLVGPAVLGEVGWYDIAVQKISLGGQEFTGFGCDPNQPGQQCIMDTGTPALVLPAEVFDYASQLIEYGESATLTFWLPGVSGEDVAVSFDLTTLNQMVALSKGGKGTNIILGLPLWAFYYTVFDITEKSVSFIPQKSQPAIPPSQPQIPAEIPEPSQPTEPTEPTPQVLPWPLGPLGPFGPVTGPSPWTPIPGHQPGAWPAPQAPQVPQGDVWPNVGDGDGGADPLGPFGIFEAQAKSTESTSSNPGDGRRMEELPVHV
ncbi:ANKRD17 [Symbiodinium natans]|uniref:ANKRD17 protein n=1 Tax=Symbiodinium natans TaxID=878477 RepID=A0A812LLP2_9DINO|nr:ANKRD17 [Symbiodinium natans]